MCAAPGVVGEIRAKDAAQMPVIEDDHVVQQPSRRGVLGEGVDQLLGGPRGGGVLGDVDVFSATSLFTPLVARRASCHRLTLHTSRVICTRRDSLVSRRDHGGSVP